MNTSRHTLHASGSDDSRTPVHVLTGFLGSGKTTLLRQLLADEALKDTAVVINEFGEVGLDHLLVRELAEDVVLLSSGCICCVVGDDLAATLAELHFMMRAGEIPSFDRLVIETTGMADPVPIMLAVMGDQRITQHYRLGQVLSTVDAVNGEATLRNHFEARQQLAAADRIILTKADLVTTDVVTSLKTKLASANPSAPISVAAKGRFSKTDVLVNLDRVGGESKNLNARISDHLGDGHTHDVHTFTIKLEKPVNWSRFVDWLELLLLARGHDILRVKGILKVDGNDKAVVIQGVQHMLYPVEVLQDRAAESGWIVFIAQNMTKQAIERSILSIYECEGQPAGSFA